MPVYAEPPMSPEEVVAINALGGNAARLRILGFLVDNPGSLVSEIAKGCGLTVGTVKTHVASLTASAVLIADPPRSVPYSDRRGQHARYTVQLDRLKAHYAEIGRMLRI